MYKRISFIIWSWLSTALFAGFIYWISAVWSNDVFAFSQASIPADEALKVVFRMVLYAILFILFYRSVIVTLRSTVKRLASWHSRREANEDAEFSLIIETLVVVVTIMFCVIFSVVEEFAQNFSVLFNQAVVPQAIYLEMQRDILVSTMAALLTALVVYSVPAIGELEIAIQEKLKREYRSFRSRSKN